MTTILSFGAGVDSSTLIAIDLNRDAAARLIGVSRDRLDRVFPSPDYIVFSDTGAESAATYSNVIKVRQHLKLRGRELITVKRDGENITEWCLRLGIVPLMNGGSHVCSLKFKGEVMAKWAKGLGIMAPTWIIGIEADEGKRAKRFTKPKGDQAEYIYPLIGLGMTREKCLKLLDQLGWHTIEKSSCVFCPYKMEAELRDMYFNDRESWALCEQIEQAFKVASVVKHQAWIDAGKPLNRGGRAPRGMWRKNSYAEGARLFARSTRTVLEWADHFENTIATIEV